MHPIISKQAKFRFYEELNDFLPFEKQKKSFLYLFTGKPTLKDAIESIGIPHTEVDLILVNGQSVDFSFHLTDGDYVSVYPVFESLDISDIKPLKEKPLRNIKFVLDVHLGKLAKFLRMLGFDTLYEKNYSDEEIVKISYNENRIILTRDLGILKNGKVTKGYWIRSQDSKIQLEEVLTRFDLYGLINQFCRCIRCNGLIEEVDKNQILHRLNPDTQKYYKTFFRCQNCDHIYWEGSHFKNMEKFIKKITCNGD